MEGILAFAERILPRASDLWVQASLDYKQRLQQLFFPEGIAFDGNRLVRTGVTAPAFSYLREIRTGKEGSVDQTGIEPSTSNRRGRRIQSRVVAICRGIRRAAARSTLHRYPFVRGEP